MLDKAEMMTLLSDASPSFRPKSQRTARYWKDEDDDVVEAVLREFAEHIVRLLRSGETNEYDAIFSAIERLHLEGNAFVRENAAPHLVDSLLWEQRRGGGTVKALRQYLGRESLGAWEARKTALGSLDM